MPDNPLKSLTNYSRYIAELLNRPTIKHSTLAVWSDSPYTGVAEGDVFFTNGLRLRMRVELNSLEVIITCYPLVRTNGYRFAEQYGVNQIPDSFPQFHSQKISKYLLTIFC